MANHLVIAGPGRAGTTLLVRLLDALGFETGIERLPFDDDANAGFEANLTSPLAPYVVKSPALTWTLPGLLADGSVDPATIDWLVVPLRELDQAAASRLAVTAGARDAFVPGGLYGTRRPGRQRASIAEATYRLLLAAAEYELPLIVLEYPRFARDAAYAFRRLRPALGDRSEAAVAAALRDVVDDRLLRGEPIAPPPALALRVLARRLRRRLRG
ncbi:MAG TPA: hypothetical protein VHD91_07425 [Gaiellaceae bacterium]|nr:hypothetical protein [Gaiellaceae bacterium]